MRPALEELPDCDQLSSIFPFSEEQVIQIARTEPTLRDMLQQFRHLFDHLIFGEASPSAIAPEPTFGGQNRLPSEPPLPQIKSVVYVEAPESPEQEVAAACQPAMPVPAPAAVPITPAPVVADVDLSGRLVELWEQEMRAARRKLETEGALTGATRELQAGLGSFLQICHEHGVKVGPWRLQHVVGELAFGDHPTYGVFTIAHWVCKDGQPWKVGVGLFLARGAGKPRELEIKLTSLQLTPPVIDHLILLRPDDDMALTGKSKTMWQDAQKKGHSARLEAVSLETYCALYAFPRWLTAVSEALPEGQPLPNLADLIQDRCEKLLEQVCMPVSQ
jgi:hypothetical protein